MQTMILQLGLMPVMQHVEPVLQGGPRHACMSPHPMSAFPWIQAVYGLRHICRRRRMSAAVGVESLVAVERCRSAVSPRCMMTKLDR